MSNKDVNPNKAGVLDDSFFWGGMREGGFGSKFGSLQPIWSRLKVKKGLSHLLFYSDVFSLFLRRKFQKILSSEPLEERCDLWYKK